MARVGLVLGAGGVVGHAFHAGVLSALAEETGWDPRDAEVILGTSAGSLVGTLLRAGFSARDLAARASGDPVSPEGARLLEAMGPSAPMPAPDGPVLRRPHLPSARLLARAAMRPWDPRPGTLMAAVAPDGRLATDHIVTGIRALMGDRWPAAALWICALRLDDGRRVVFGKDARTDPATAVAASCAIPAFYRPVRIDGMRYVDGGAHSPTNADLMGGLGLDLVVVCSPMSIAPGLTRLSLDVGARTYSRVRLAAEVARVRARGTPVVTFEPGAADLRAMGLNAMDPAKRRAVVRRARETTARRLARPVDELASLRA